MLIEAAIFRCRSNHDRANCGGWHDEGVAHELRTSGLNGVVVGDDAVSPDLMKVVEASIHIDETIGEAMRAFVEITARLDKTTLMQDLSGCVFYGELHPGLVHVTLLGHVTV